MRDMIVCDNVYPGMELTSQLGKDQSYTWEGSVTGESFVQPLLLGRRGFLEMKCFQFNIIFMPKWPIWELAYPDSLQVFSCSLVMFSQTGLGGLVFMCNVS